MGPSISPLGQVCCRISSGEGHRKGVCSPVGWICCRICSGNWYRFIRVGSCWWICYRVCLKMKWSLSEYYNRLHHLHPQPQLQQSCRIFLGRTKACVKLEKKNLRTSNAVEFFEERDKVSQTNPSKCVITMHYPSVCCQTKMTCCLWSFLWSSNQLKVWLE